MLLIFLSLSFCPAHAQDSSGVHQGSLVFNEDILVDSVFIIEGDREYYRYEPKKRWKANGEFAGIDSIAWFKESNPDQVYVITRPENLRPLFVGRIKPGNNYHGTCRWYFRVSDQSLHLAKEEHYINGVKHGREVQFNRDGSVNWEKMWLNGQLVEEDRP